MEIIEKTGKDLEELLDSVCNELNITRDDFYYKYEERKNGFLGKNSVIDLKVYLKSELLKDIKNYLEELLTNMGLTVNFETKLREGLFFVKIYSSNNPILIGKGGNTLKSLEYMVKQRISNLYNIHPLINLDVENYREKQAGRLEHMAKKLAKEVVKTKMEVHLENMNAYDRRIVHNALTNFKGIKTESTGEEPERHIVIKPE